MFSDWTMPHPGLFCRLAKVATEKVTTLLAIALHLARPGQAVVLVTEQRQELAIFSPLPENWRGVLVEPTEASWLAALSAVDVADDAMVLVSNLSLVNHKAVWQACTVRWVLATVDTAMIGIDVAYPLYQMGISNETFGDLVRLVWSQLLVETLCTQCSVPAQLTTAEVVQRWITCFQRAYPVLVPGSRWGARFAP